MGIINETGAKLALAGEEYRLLFTVNAIEKIEDEMGESIDSLPQYMYKTNKDGNVTGFKYSNVAKVLCILVNEAIEIREENTKTELEHLTIEQIKRRISNANIAMCTDAIASAFSLSFLEKKDEDENPKKSSLR